MDSQTSCDLEVVSAWVYIPGGSLKKLKIGFNHQWVVQQQSMSWFKHTLVVHLN